ncbi:hypothetical protein ABT026_03490 [Streptomyces sp. NPDC002734]|uniref:hypothetical protein n=1 Tax=Streptomyces sp. NPDC002734 TaxID=3154426 RepID=UPI003328BEE0
MKRDPMIRAAARNNAEWCAVMSRAHGLVGEFGTQAWAVPSRPPLYYPDAVTLVPGTDATALLERIDTATPGACVKDSFADLDLSGAGFTVLFDAQWIHRPASARATAPATRPEFTWSEMSDPEALRAWALAWVDGDANGGHPFRPELLDDPTTSLLAGHAADGTVTAGAVASRSDHVVGISNVFAVEGGTDRAWPGLLGAVHRLFPTLPVVGYAHGADLDAAVRHGFRAIGPLRVWRHQDRHHALPAG